MTAGVEAGKPGQMAANARGVFQIRGCFITGGIERLGGRGVKASMELVRTVMSSLLIALWVLAAEHCHADPVIGCPDGSCRTSVSATQDGDHAPLTDVRAFENSARLLNRRVGMQAGRDGLLMPADVSTSMLGEVERFYAPLTVSIDTLAIAKCWQFHWRAASEPRAPSSAS